MYSPLGDGTCSLCFKLCPDFINNDNLGHVVLYGFDHHRVLLGRRRHLHTAGMADSRMGNVPIAGTFYISEESDVRWQTICYLTLYGNVDATSAEGWKKDVTAGVNQRQAFYRWLAKEGVSAFGAAASLIQLSLQEFYLKVTNPNNYEISLDSLNINFTVEASTGETVTAAKQSLGEPVWVPAKQAVNVRVLAPVKTMDVITWQIMIGKSTSQAMALAADVWGQIQAGTAKWDVSVEATVSSEKETLTETYNL